MSKKPDAQSGRVAFDDRGQPEASPVPRVEGFDPYSTATAPRPAQKPRRTLDDMRKLSEEIKRNRQLKSSSGA
jgi:hypothetical protein